MLDIAFASNLVGEPLFQSIAPSLEAAARSPILGGEFEESTRHLREALPFGQLLPALFAAQYDALTVTESGEFRAFIAFSKKPGSWHCFFWHVLPEFQRRLISAQMSRVLILAARSTTGVTRVRIWGKGKNRPADLDPVEAEKMARIYARIAENRLNLPFAVAGLDDGWIDLRPQSASVAT